MLLTENKPIEGIVPNVPGILYGQNARTDELNARLFGRYFPDAPLAPNFDPRPISTKYAYLPIIDRRKDPIVPIEKYLDHSPESVEGNFYCGTDKAPSDGFFRNVDTESTLRSQFFALQRDAGQSVYIPGTESDMYRTTAVGRQETQTHPNLFTKESHRSSNTEHLAKIGKKMFYNGTRDQMRGEYLQTIDKR